MSESDTISWRDWPSYPHGYAPDGILWPAFTDTLGVWARCRHCTYDAWGENLAAVGVQLIWHLYDAHPAVWRRQYGAHRRPVEARPADLDTREIDGADEADENTRDSSDAM